MIANNLKPRSLPAQLWHIATSPVNRRNRRWLLGCWLIEVGHTITARYGYHATPNVATATKYVAWKVTEKESLECVDTPPGYAECDEPKRFTWQCRACGEMNSDTRQSFVLCVECGVTYDKAPIA